MARTYKLTEVSPTEVQFSKQNPRGESPEQIRNDKTFEQLKDSVYKFGVLVPIVVHRLPEGAKKKYILVDGERRLRAALATRTKKIPAHVAEAEDRMSAPDPRLLQIKAGTGLSEGVPADGGFLVQQDFVATILQRTYEIGGLLSRVQRIPISTNSNGIKINAINETSRAAGSRYGGVQTYWLDEAGTKTASHPTFRQIELNLKKLAALVYATDELLQDAGALQAILMQILPEEINFVTENAIIRGTGVGQPLGILNSGARVTQAAEAAQAANTIVFENIINMWSRMYARSRSNAVWLINQDCEPQLMAMSLAVGAGGVPVYMPAGGINGAPYSTLMGRPVIATEYNSTLGTEGDIILVDPSQYLMIDKGGIQSASSIHVRFVNDETVFRFVYRVDGQPTWNAPLTPAQGTVTQSPYVTLATRP